MPGSGRIWRSRSAEHCSARISIESARSNAPRCSQIKTLPDAARRESFLGGKGVRTDHGLVIAERPLPTSGLRLEPFQRGQDRVGLGFPVGFFGANRRIFAKSRLARIGRVAIRKRTVSGRLTKVRPGHVNPLLGRRRTAGGIFADAPQPVFTCFHDQGIV